MAPGSVPVVPGDDLGDVVEDEPQPAPAPTTAGPAVEEAGDGWRFLWKSGATILIDHLVEEKQTVSAEVTVHMGERFLHSSTMNLGSEPTKKTLAAKLEGDEPVVRWREYVEYAAYEARRRHRERPAPAAEQAPTTETPRADKNEVAVETHGGGWSFHWPSTGVTIIVDRLFDSKGQITGEITVSVPDTVLHNSDMNLGSEPTKRVIVNKLAGEYPEVHWQSYVEYVCIEAKNRFRRTNKPLRASDMDPTILDEPVFFIDPWIAADGGTVVAAHGGTGKSTLAILWALIAAYGLKNVLGTPRFGPKTVLICDWENRERPFLRRLNALCKWLGVPWPDNVYHLHMTASLHSSQEIVQQWVRELDVDLVIYDSLIGAVGGSLNDDDGTARFAAAANAISVLWMGITHISKGMVERIEKGETEGIMPIGHVGNYNWARSVLTLTGEDTDEPSVRHLILRHEKMNEGAKAPPHTIEVRYTMSDEPDRGDRIERIEFRPIEAHLTGFADAVPLFRRTLDYVRAHPGKGLEEIAETLNTPTAAVEDFLTKHVVEGRLHLKQEDDTFWPVERHRDPDDAQ